MTTVLLVGAGAVGVRAARQLTDTPGIKRLLVADKRTRRASAAASALGELVEASEWSPRDAIPDGVRAVAVALPAAAEQAAVERAIEAGVPVATVGDDAVVIGRLRALDPAAREADVAVLVGCGLAPGLSDVLARHAARAFDMVDEVHVARFGVGGPASRESVRRALGARAAELADGAVEVSGRSRGHSLVWFPDPVAVQECRPVGVGLDLLSEAVPGVRYATVAYAEPPPRRRLPSVVRPPDPLAPWSAVRVEVWGRHGGRRAPLVYGVVDRTAVVAGTVLGVAAAGLVGAVDLGAIPAGVRGLGAAADPVAVLAELARRGVRAAAFEGVPVS